MEGPPYDSWQQRTGIVEHADYKGRDRMLSIFARFVCQDQEVVRLNWARVDMFEPQTHRPRGSSMILYNELEGGDPIKQHKSLDVIEFAVTALEIDQDLRAPTHS